MTAETLRTLLQDVLERRLTIDGALERLRRLPFEQTEHATIDHHRAVRCGMPEVVLAQGKTPSQVKGIARRLSATGASVLVTRANPDVLRELRAEPGEHCLVSEPGRCLLLNPPDEPDDDVATVSVVCAGTADLPVLEEASMTLRAAGVRQRRIVDVGVAGLHRLLPHVPDLQRSVAIVVIAGMEGALPSVVGGLVGCPVFAVPTSTGYGVSFAGLSALLGMLNSCSSNVSVANIDNGFGAAYCAGTVARQVRRAYRSASQRPAR